MSEENKIGILEGEDAKFSVVNDDGVEVECEIVFTHHCEENGKNYIAYTDGTVDEDGDTALYASVYDPEKEDTLLLPIETDEEWELIESVLATIQGEAE